LTEEESNVLTTTVCDTRQNIMHNGENITSTHNNEVPSYNLLMDKCNTLCRLIQNSKEHKVNVNMILTKMIDRFKKGQSVNANFDEFDDVNHQLSTSLVSQPMVGQTQNIANATQIGRLKSIREIRSTKSPKKRKKGVVSSSFNNQCDDFAHALPGKSQQRTCKICHKGGHRTFNCPKITKYGVPLQRDNRELRVELAQTLNTAKTYVWYHLDQNNLPILYDEVPQKNVSAIVLHKIWCSGLGDNDVYVEITALDRSGDVSTDYCNVLIKKHSVSVWITRSKTNLIVNLLQKKQENDEFGPLNTQTVFVSPPTQTQVLPFEFQRFGQQGPESFNDSFNDSQQQTQFLGNFPLSQSSQQSYNDNCPHEFKKFM
jgi:hypothetical protein